MKTIVNKGLKFGSFLIKKLKGFLESYDDIHSNLSNLDEDYRMFTIMGSVPFYYYF